MAVTTPEDIKRWNELVYQPVDYTLLREDYLLATWHPSTRPAELDLADDPTKWLGLEVRRHTVQDADHASVEFVARYRQHFDDRGTLKLLL